MAWMNRDRIGGIFLLGLGLALFLKSLSYPLGTLRKPGGGLLPAIASALLMGLSALLTLQAFRGKEMDKSSQSPFFPEKEAPRRIILGFASLLGYRYLLPVIGFAPSTGVFIIFLSRFLGKYGWMVSVIFALLTAVTAHYLFQVWLKIPMPRPYIVPSLKIQIVRKVASKLPIERAHSKFEARNPKFEIRMGMDRFSSKNLFQAEQKGKEEWPKNSIPLVWKSCGAA